MAETLLQFDCPGTMCDKPDSVTEASRRPDF